MANDLYDNKIAYLSVAGFLHKISRDDVLETLIMKDRDHLMPPVAFQFSSYTIADFVQVDRKYVALSNDIRLMVGDMDIRRPLHLAHIKQHPQKKVILGPGFDPENRPTFILSLESGLFRMDINSKKLVKIDHNVSNG